MSSPPNDDPMSASPPRAPWGKGRNGISCASPTSTAMLLASNTVAATSPLVPLDESTAVDADGVPIHFHRRICSEPAPLGWNSMRAIPKCKPPLPKRGHRRSRSTPIVLPSMPLDGLVQEVSPAMNDPEVKMFQCALQKMKSNCPSKAEGMAFEAHLAKIANIYDALANYMFSKGWNEDALDTFQKALSSFRVAYNGDMNDAVVASIYVNMGRTLWRLEQNADANKCMEQAYHIRRRTLGSSHEDTGNSLHIYGQSLCMCGKAEKARLVLQEALDIRRRTMGGNNIEVARTISLLGNVQKQLGHLTEALMLHKEALQMKVSALKTKQHHSVVVSLTDIASVYRSMKRNSDAIKMYEKVLDIQSALCMDAASSENPSEYLDVAVTLHSMGSTWQELGDFDEARTRFQHAALMYARAGLEDSDKCIVSLTQSIAEVSS